MFSIILWTKEAFQRFVLELLSRKKIRFPNKRKVGLTDFSDTIWNPEHLCWRVSYGEVTTLPSFLSGAPEHSRVSHPQPPSRGFGRCIFIATTDTSTCASVGVIWTSLLSTLFVLTSSFLKYKWCEGNPMSAAKGKIKLRRSFSKSFF